MIGVINKARNITYSKKAQKYIARLGKIHKQAIKGAIECLPSGDIKYFKSDDVYRLRVGDFRIIYYLVDDNGDIHIDKIGPRGDVYK